MTSNLTGTIKFLYDLAQRLDALAPPDKNGNALTVAADDCRREAIQLHKFAVMRHGAQRRLLNRRSVR
jgi:hypothetical protein